MQINKDNIFLDKYEVTSYNVDWDYKASLNYIFSLIQDVAGNHSYLRDASIPQLQREGKTWVISRSIINIDKYASWPETIEVQTWAEEPKGYKCPRITRIINSKNEKLLQAFSYWVIMDTKKRRPIKPLDIEKDRIKLVDPKFKEYQVPLVTEKIKRITEEDKLISSYEPQSFPLDSDYNGHTNNISYLNWLVNAFPQDFINHRLARKIDIVWLKETHYGDRFLVSTYTSSPELFKDNEEPIETHQIIEVLDKEGNKEICCEAVINWKNRYFFYSVKN